VRLTVTIVADCDPPPDAAWLETDGLPELATHLEDAAATVLFDHGAGFSIKASSKVEL
jgi:hypothetical protein